jgi:hypothetical protein
MNRRSFVELLAGGAAALGVNVPFTTAAPVEEGRAPSVTSGPSGRAKISMEQYTSDAFASRVGEVFSFHRTAGASDSPIRLELVDVHTSPHAAITRGRQPFSLMFALRSEDATQESTLHLRHDEFEPCAWFVNRVTAPERKRRVPHYEAVFG